MGEDRWIISESVASRARRVREELLEAALIEHRGEAGRGREQVIREFLSTVLPAGFAVSSGFVIDATGAKSRQVDVVVCRPGDYPIFSIAGINHFIIESVVAVVEIKASLSSVSGVVDACDAVASVKRLDRTNRGSNAVVQGGNHGEMVDAYRDRFEIFGGVFVERSPNPNVVVSALLACLKGDDWRTAPNFYAALTGLTDIQLARTEELGFFIGYRDRAGNLSTNMDRTLAGAYSDVLVSTARPEPVIQSCEARVLTRMAATIVTAVRYKPVVDYSVEDYFFREPGE